MDKNCLNDRYWDDRKRFVSVFNQQKTIFNYITLLKNLGFIVSPKRNGYHAGKRITKYDESGKPCWISGTEKQYNPFLGMVEKRIFPDFKKHLFITDRNCGVKKLPDGIEEKDQYVVGKNIRGLVNTFGLLQRSTSDVLALDIDKRIADRYEFSSTFEVLDYILGFLKIDPKNLLLVEYNKFNNGGLHVYMRIGKGFQPCNRNRLGLFIEKSTGFDVEYKFSENLLRLPFSYEYRPIKLSKFKKIVNMIRRGLEVSDDCFYANLDEAIKSVDMSKIALSEDNCDYLKHKDIQFSFEKTKEFALACFSRMANFMQERKEYIRKLLMLKKEENRGYTYSDVYTLNDYINKHRFGLGESWKALQKVVPYMKARGYSEPEVYNTMRQMDEGSKLFGVEIRNSRDKIKDWYMKCNSSAYAIRYDLNTGYKLENIHVPETALGWKVGYVENSQNIKSCYKDDFEKPYTGLYIYKHFIEAAKMLLEDEGISTSLKKTCEAVIKEKYREQLIHQLPVFVEEIMGKYQYDLKYKNFRKQAEGLQIPEILMERIVQFANIKRPERGTHVFNCKQFRIILLRMFGLHPVTIKSVDKRPYSKHHCTVWNNIHRENFDLFEDFMTGLKVQFEFYVNREYKSVKEIYKSVCKYLDRLVERYGLTERSFYKMTHYLTPIFTPPNRWLNLYKNYVDNKE